MELRALRYFVTVAEERHFGRAAQRLHIVQPAVSQQIARLERELGVTLLDRSPRHVRLTAAGERVLDAAREAIAAADRVRMAAGASAGAVRVGTAPGLTARLERGLARLRACSPDVEAELTELPVADRLDAVRTGRLDLALVRGPVAASDLTVLPAWTEGLYAVVSTRHPAAVRPVTTLADLATYPLRLPAPECDPPLRAAVVAALDDAGVTPATGRPAGSLPNTLVEVGAGPPTWALLPADLVDSAGVTGVHALRLDLPAHVVGHVVAPPSTPCATALVAAFADDRR